MLSADDERSSEKRVALCILQLIVNVDNKVESQFAQLPFLYMFLLIMYADNKDDWKIMLGRNPIIFTKCKQIVNTVKMSPKN